MLSPLRGFGTFNSSATFVFQRVREVAAPAYDATHIGDPLHGSGILPPYFQKSFTIEVSRVVYDAARATPTRASNVELRCLTSIFKDPPFLRVSRNLAKSSRSVSELRSRIEAFRP